MGDALMLIPAHIGNIPVEEWLPFVVPVLVLYLFGRRRERRRRASLKRLPNAGESLNASTVEHVLARWSESEHDGLSRAHLPLLYPPGPDGFSARQLAERIHADRATVERLLAELEAHGYVRLEDRGNAADGPRPSMTWEGYELLLQTEDALLDAADEVSAQPSVQAKH